MLERSKLPLGRALEQVAGLQTQYAPSAYIRLWSSLEGFRLADLTRALERKRAVQGTLMRSTIHVVSPRDYWQFAEGIGPSRQEWWLRTHGRQVGGDVDLDEVATQFRSELAGRVWHRNELDALLRARGSTIWSGAWVALVRVPPSGTWERRRADLFGLAEEWLGPSAADEEQGLEHLLRRYLAGFGPAKLVDAAGWAGVPLTKLRPVAERLRLRAFRDEEGKELLDLPRAPLPGGDAPAPVRFLPTWDATLLVHARRTQILPERFRPLVFHTKTPHSVPTFLVDGAVAGKWRTERTARRATLILEPFEPLPRAARAALRDEAEGLVRFVEADVPSYKVSVAGSA
ncbi:MAG: winged helix DNA-binding domain-containing protein [Gaiellaceae bacterium]